MTEKEQKKYDELIAISHDQWPAKLKLYAQKVKDAQGGTDPLLDQVEEMVRFYVVSGAAFSA